jgi:flagellar hook-length control protein FliK
MEDLGIKKNVYMDTGASGSAGREKLAGLAASFQDMISKSGTQFDAKMGSMMDNSTISSMLQPSQSTDHRRDSGARDDDPGQDLKSSRVDDDHGGRRDDSPRADNHDNSRPERADTHTEERVQSNSGERDDSRNDNANPHKADTDTASRDNDRGDSSSASNDGAGNSGEHETFGQNNAKGDNQHSGENTNQGDTGSTDGTGAVAQTSQTAANVNLNLAAVLTGAQAVGEQGEISATAKAGPADMAASAISVGAKQGAAQGQTGNQSHTLGQNNQAMQAAQQQAQNPADAARAATAAQQQGAELAKAIGGNDKTLVNVTVTDEAETLTSKPTSSLTTGSVLASANAKGPAQGNNQAAANQANATHGSPQAVAAQNQAAQNQAQNQAQQNANQNAQTQAASALGDGKGGAQGVQSAQGASATAGSAGGDSGAGQTAATNSSTNTQQTQQSQQSQQAQANGQGKAATTSQPVADQISVKVTKAIQAGTDRISVQLRPAELGRVDVKMELGHDGRVMAVVTAENKDTLELLKRDSADLQKAFEEAGLKLDSGDLNFNLRGGESQLAEQDAGGPSIPEGEIEDSVLDDGILDAAIVAEQNTDILNGRIDVKA